MVSSSVLDASTRTRTLEQQRDAFAQQADAETQKLRDIYDLLGVTSYEEALVAIETLQLDIGLARAVAHAWFASDQDGLLNAVEKWADEIGDS